MRAEDQFHIGIVVTDFEATLASLSELFGYEWCEEFRSERPVSTPAGEILVDFGFVYSRSAPRLEIIRVAPGTLWEPVPGSTVHHVGFWSDDVPGDAQALERRGYEWEASGLGPDGVPYFTFHRSPTGFRTELVSRALQPGLEQYWADGRMPSA